MLRDLVLAGRRYMLCMEVVGALWIWEVQVIESCFFYWWLRWERPGRRVIMLTIVGRYMPTALAPPGQSVGWLAGVITSGSSARHRPQTVSNGTSDNNINHGTPTHDIRDEDEV